MSMSNIRGGIGRDERRGEGEGGADGSRSGIVVIVMRRWTSWSPRAGVRVDIPLIPAVVVPRGRPKSAPFGSFPVGRERVRSRSPILC